jgi:short-subunit dehydrogenase
MKWSGSTVLISGASSGIGEELARQAVAQGARVGLLARSADALEKLTTDLGDACVAAPADVTSPAEVTAALDTVERRIGPIDICVANAGIGLYGAFLDADAADVERVMRTNYLGVVHLFQAVLPGMVTRRRGHLVTVGSISGRIGSPFEAAYSASKFAVSGLTEALSVELSPFDIAVSLVNPGPVETPFFANRGHGYERKRPAPASTAEVARTILRTVERDRPESFVSGFMRQAVVAKTLVPPLYRWGTARAFAGELADQRRTR